MNTIHLLGALLVSHLAATTAFSVNLWERHSAYCRHLDDPPRAHPPGESGRHYAPSREMDVLHLALDVTPDFAQRTVSGQATIRFAPIATPKSRLSLDAVNLDVTSVTGSADIAHWHNTDEQIIIDFQKPIPAGQETSVTVTYSARPERGLYFRTPEMGYPEGDMHIWTQGEPSESRHWFPCYDFPNEKFTSEITCHVPDDMQVLSNGSMVSATRHPDTGLKAVRWLQDKPHVTYLITLIAGYFEKIEDRHGEIPLNFWTVPSEIQYAENSFEDTKDMMVYFEEITGTPYPWDKYDQVCVLDFHWGGMENTSQTTLNNSTLFTDASENIRSSQGLVAHELAHQWFGDFVTCKDWSHIWLNEGFATYYEALYDGHKHGRETFLYRMHSTRQGLAAQRNDVTPMVRRDFKQPTDQFNYLAYPKGAFILHMLRGQLGEELFNRCVQTYLERHAFGVVQTQDLVDVLEELSGQSFDLFFDQYVYHAHHPELKIEYRWDAAQKLAKLSVSQEQTLGETVLLFTVPLTVRFHTSSGSLDRVITIREKAQDFYFALQEQPEIVRIDPEVALLAQIDFKPTSAMLYRQLENQQDMPGRLIAAEQLGEKKDKGAVDELKEALNNDGFWAVRLEASKALRTIGGDEAYAALRESLNQPDARVRQRVVRDIAGFYQETTRDALADFLDSGETNPEILAVAITALGTYSGGDVAKQLKTWLKTDSFRNRLAEAAIAGMRNQDDPDFVEPLRKYLERNEEKFLSARNFGRALDTLAFLARHDDDKDAVREFLLEHVSSRKERVQLAAINALGDLGDPKAVAPLRTFLGEPEDSDRYRAADRAIKAIEEGKAADAAVGNLRNEVMELQKDNKKLQEQFKDLKKQLEALTNGRESDDSDEEN